MWTMWRKPMSEGEDLQPVAEDNYYLAKFIDEKVANGEVISSENVKEWLEQTYPLTEPWDRYQLSEDEKSAV